MKIVLDTNVLVSGLLRPYSIPGEIVLKVSQGDLLLCYDVRILGEYDEVLRRRHFPFNTAIINLLLDQIKVGGYLVAGSSLSKRLPDPSDEIFLEIAIAGQAQYLVTGNLKDFPADKRQGMNVVSPADFLKIYRKESLE